MKRIFIACTLLFIFQWAFSQQDARTNGLNAITKDVVKGQLEFLSSDWMQGRGTGTEGEYMAGDYIASLFKIYGIKPAGDMPLPRTMSRRSRTPLAPSERSYFQEFNLVEYTPGDQQALSIIQDSKFGTSETLLQYKTDFSTDLTDVAVDIMAPVAFVGYGLSMDSLQYNDYKGIDVKGKVILRISGYPGFRDTTSPAYVKFHPRDRNAQLALNQSKNKAAQNAGAIGIIEFTPGVDPSNGWAANVPFRYNTSTYEGPIDPSSVYSLRMKAQGDTIDNNLPRAILSLRAWNKLLEGTSIDCKSFEAQVARSMKPASKDLPGKKIHMTTSVKTRIIRTRNVLGMIEGEDTNHIIVAGAHYDHLGTRDGFIYNGADDNGSGTVGVLSLAKAFATSGIKPKYTIIFGCWTAEEKGLIGSYYFVGHTPNPAGKILLALNYDMISRNEDSDSLKNKCSMVYTKPYKVLETITKENVDQNKLNLDVSFRPADKPRGGSDHTPFAEKGIPVMYLMAGFLPDYHTPYDQVEKVDPDKIARITRLGYLNLWDLATGKVALTKN